MFTTETVKLHKEITGAVTARDARLDKFEEMVRHFHGPTYGGSDKGIEKSTVNHTAIWLSVILPKLIHRNPKVSVTTRKSIDGEQSAIEEAASALKAFLNAWVNSQNLAKKMKNCAVEYSLAWCAGMVVRKKHPGDPTQDTEVENFLPEFSRIPIWRMIIDPHCENFADARFVGHTWFADKEDLIKTAENADEEDGWDLNAIKRLEPDGGASIRGTFDTRHEASADREEVHLIDLWIPEAVHEEKVGPEDGFHGTLMTLGWEQGGSGNVHIRKPRPYYGPPTGPYALGGYMAVPTKVFPLGPLMITKGHEDLLRAMVGHANTSCSEYRKVILVPGGTDIEESAMAAAVGRNQIVVVPGLASDAAPIVVEVGGVTDTQLRNIAYSRNELEGASGLDSAGAGEVRGASTATENAIADESRKSIIGHITDNFHLFVKDIIEKAAWYGFHDERIKISITHDAKGLEEFESPQFVGGPGDLPISAFIGMSIDIEAMSMERVSEALHQRRVLQVLQIITGIAPLVRQIPEVDWKALIAKIGDAMNMPDLEEIVNYELAAKLMGVPVEPSAADNEAPGMSAGLNSQSGERREVQGRLTGALANVQGVA